MRWIREDGIHITLKFLGEVDEGKVKQVTSALETISSLHSAVRILISGLGTFPEKGRPRIIWLGAREETGHLKGLVEGIEKEMEKIGFEKETRYFKPHVTIGRVKRYRDPGKGFFMKQEHREISFGSFQAEQIVLMKSTLLPDGARYEKIATFPLKKQPS